MMSYLYLFHFNNCKIGQKIGKFLFVVLTSYFLSLVVL